MLNLKYEKYNHCRNGTKRSKPEETIDIQGEEVREIFCSELDNGECLKDKKDLSRFNSIHKGQKPSTYSLIKRQIDSCIDRNYR